MRTRWVGRSCAGWIGLPSEWIRGDERIRAWSEVWGVEPFRPLRHGLSVIGLSVIGSRGRNRCGRSRGERRRGEWVRRDDVDGRVVVLKLQIRGRLRLVLEGRAADGLRRNGLRRRSVDGVVHEEPRANLLHAVGPRAHRGRRLAGGRRARLWSLAGGVTSKQTLDGASIVAWCARRQRSTPGSRARRTAVHEERFWLLGGWGRIRSTHRRRAHRWGRRARGGVAQRGRCVASGRWWEGASAKRGWGRERR
jgi:hypothetical protein